MSINKSYAVFGLGRYGRAVVKELLDNGAAVIAVDKDRKIVDEVVGEIPICKCADITEPGVIKQLGIQNVDVVVISMAENFEGSIMATMLCKEAGVKRVVVKCANEAQCSILRKIGADETVLPEREAGTRLAKNILSADFIDIADISEDISILELDIKPDWIGKTLKELDLRRKYNINVLAFRKGSRVDVAINPDASIEDDMKMIVMANCSEIKRIK
ncbi:MAG: TrkA family potassium uptake protein [Clostridia bacterium]|nr:TrkA family potassium uptake protein [Oscillospiraceae bacterium]MBQ7033144.1 TrkA family potassium uptake protein [Clostridia bacterium]